MLRNLARNIEPDLVGSISASILREDFKQNFDAGGRPIHWMPPKRRPGGMPLKNNGILQNSIFAGKDSIGWRVFTQDERAGTLNFGAKQGAYGRSRRGGPIPWGTIPPRPFFVLRPEAIQRIMNILAIQANRNR